MEDDEGEALLLEDAERASRCVECDGGDVADVHFCGGVLHQSEHGGGVRAEGDEVEAVGGVVRGEDTIVVCEDAGFDAW